MITKTLFLKYYKSVFLALVCTVLLSVQANAQERNVKLDAKLSPDSILIGDHVKLSLQATYDTTYQAIALPQFEKNKIGEVIDIIEMFKLDTVKIDGSQITVDQSYLITSFDSGYYAMAAPMLLQTLERDTLMVDTLNFPLVALYVNTIPIDTATYEMYDIKDISEYPFFLWDSVKQFMWDYWWIGAIILGLALIAFGVWWYLRRLKNKGRFFIFARPQDPPYIIAFSELQKLKEEKLWEQDKTKQYYTRLTDIIRKYLEDTYGLQAMEKTSEEILRDLKTLKLEKQELYDELKEMFTYSDLAKFAKYNPSPLENEQAYKYA